MKMITAALVAASMLVPVATTAALAATPADALVVAANIDDIVSIDPAEAYEFSSGEYVTQTYGSCLRALPPNGRWTMPLGQSPSRFATA